MAAGIGGVFLGPIFCLKPCLISGLASNPVFIKPRAMMRGEFC
jgi:hypothetical protein